MVNGEDQGARSTMKGPGFAGPVGKLHGFVSKNGDPNMAINDSKPFGKRMTIIF